MCIKIPRQLPLSIVANIEKVEYGKLEWKKENKGWKIGTEK